MYNSRYKGRKMYKMRDDSIHSRDTCTGHSYGSWTVTKAATCTTAGTEKRTCTRSGCTASETRSISATGHTFNGSYTVTKEAHVQQPVQR